MEETEENNNEIFDSSYENPEEIEEENKIIENEQNLEENKEQIQEQEKNEEIENNDISLKNEEQPENLRYEQQNEVEENALNNLNEEKNEENEENKEKEENDNNKEITEENKESVDYIENIEKSKKSQRNKKLPKILNFAKSQTTNTINQITTKTPEKKRSSEFLKMHQKILEFTSPKIRNNYYNNLKTLDNIFLQKKAEYDKQNKLMNMKELTPEEFEKEQLAKIERIKNPFKLTNTETKKYLDIYNYSEIQNEMNNLKSSYKQRNYKSTDFNTTRFSEAKAFKIFYSKMRKDNEIIRKGGSSIKTPSFNLIRAAKKYNVVPNPVGVVKRKGEINKMEMRNRLCGDNYVKCLCESLKISEHITEINLKKNRLSDISIIQLFNSIIKNNILLKQLTFIDLSFNKLGFAGTTIICQYMSEFRTF